MIENLLLCLGLFRDLMGRVQLWRRSLESGGPGGEGDVTADAGGIAHGQGERRRGAPTRHTRKSTTAARRMSRR